MGWRLRKHLQDARAGKVKGAYAGHAADSAETDLFQFRSHMPYRYADQLAADEILAHRDFYSMPDSEVRKEFFHKRKDIKGKKLEGMLALLLFFIFLGGAFFSWGFFTGEVIQDQSISPNFGIFLLIILFLGIFLFFLRKIIL